LNKSKAGQVAIEAARAAGVIIMNNYGTITDAQIETKKKFDFVTGIDKESEARIIDIIHRHYPQHKIYAEETIQQQSGGYRWIIDPLDGTTNYIHGVPIFSVSIGLELDSKLILGVVYDPNQDDMFYAEKGKGAFLNDEPIQVSPITQPDMALLATGYPFEMKEYIDLYQESFKRLFHNASGIRRAGSAAMDLCYIACGRYDGFWELGLQAWDLAAGSLILQQAGGKITDFGGGHAVLRTGNTIASNSHLHDFLLDAIQNVFAGVIDK